MLGIQFFISIDKLRPIWNRLLFFISGCELSQLQLAQWKGNFKASLLFSSLLVSHTLHPWLKMGLQIGVIRASAEELHREVNAFVMSFARFTKTAVRITKMFAQNH